MWMWRRVLVGGVVVVCACVGDSSSQVDGGADATADTGGDVTTTDATGEAGDAGGGCDLTLPFAAPVALAELNTSVDDFSARLTHDELVVYFERNPFMDAGVDGGVGWGDLFTATRALKTDPFGAVSPLTTLNTAYSEGDPSPTLDNETLYYATDQATLTTGGFDLVAATRTLTSAPFANPADLSGVNSTSVDAQPYVLPDDLVLYFMSDRNGNRDLFRASRTSTSASFTVDTSGALAALNTTSEEDSPVVAPDELTVYFASARTDGNAKGGLDIWKSTRSSPSSAFGAPVNVSELNTGKDETPTWISDDGCRLYLWSNNTTANDRDIFVASKPVK
jgi:hypothetical protein